MTQPENDAPGPLGYVARFERIGRHRNVPPLPLPNDSDEWCDALLKHGRRYLGSRDIGVSWGIDGTNRGMFWAGMHNGGEFVIEPSEAA